MDVIKGVVTIKPRANIHVRWIDISLNSKSKTYSTRISPNISRNFKGIDSIPSDTIGRVRR